MKVKSSDYQHIIHPFPALYDGESRVLILGSLPSVKSREQNFFYGHPQNRFWKVISSIFGADEPHSIEEKKELILQNHLALWDTIFSCDIIGSADSTIKNVVPTDLNQIISNSKIERIYCNGKTSGKYFSKFQEKSLKRKAEVLPSTSPANAAFSLEKLIEEWSVIKNSN